MYKVIKSTENKPREKNDRQRQREDDEQDTELEVLQRDRLQKTWVGLLEAPSDKEE